MFWKKKESAEKKKTLIKSAPETRGAFRVNPMPDEPIEFIFCGKTVSAIDISSGGFSFNDNGFKPGIYDVAFTLPGNPLAINTKLELMRIIPEKNICCCQFVELTLEQEDAIAHYVLIRQKQDLQMRKNPY